MKNISKAPPLEVGGIPACATHNTRRVLRIRTRRNNIGVADDRGGGGGQPQALRVVPAARVTPSPLVSKSIRLVRPPVLVVVRDFHCRAPTFSKYGNSSIIVVAGRTTFVYRHSMSGPEREFKRGTPAASSNWAAVESTGGCGG